MITGSESRSAKCLTCGKVITYHGITPPKKPYCHKCEEEKDDEVRLYQERRNAKGKKGTPKG